MTHLTHGDLVRLVCDREVEAGRMVWCETALGSVQRDVHYVQGVGVGPPVPDVLSITRSYPAAGGYDVRIFEVKASRADFRADMRAEKWRRYLPASSRLYFAVPLGLVTPPDVPAEAGLIGWDWLARVWRTMRAAPRRTIEAPLTTNQYCALLMAGDESRGVRNLHARTMAHDGRKHRHIRRTAWHTVLDEKTRAESARDEALAERARLRREAGRCPGCGWKAGADRYRPNHWMADGCEHPVGQSQPPSVEASV